MKISPQTFSGPLEEFVSYSQTPYLVIWMRPLTELSQNCPSSNKLYYSYVLPVLSDHLSPFKRDCVNDAH